MNFPMELRMGLAKCKLPDAIQAGAEEVRRMMTAD